MNPVLQAAVAKARAGQPLSSADEQTLRQGIAHATSTDPAHVAGTHAETLELVKAQRLTIVEDGAGNLTIAELMVLPVNRGGINFPTTGYCLVTPTGDPVHTLFGHMPEEAWAAGQREHRKTAAELAKLGWRVVLADFPDAS
jgi:hypothetical protein